MKTAYQFNLIFAIAIGVSAFSYAGGAQGKSDVIATYDGVPLTTEQMRKDIGLDLYQAEHDVYKLKKEWVEKKAKDAFFDTAAKEAGLSRKEWEKREIDNRVIPPTKVEVEQFIKHNMSPEDAAKPDAVSGVTDYLRGKKRDEKEEDVYQDLLKKHHIAILLAKPKAPHVQVSFSADDPVMGSANAPVTIVEFTDFQCPYCKSSQDSLRQLEKLYNGKIKLVARQFPMPFHDRALPASEAAMCAKEQGKYWEYRDMLFDKQELSDKDFGHYAHTLGLNEGQFSKCLSEHKYAARIQKDVADGQSFGVRSTPTFFFNGRPVVGSPPLADYRDALDDEIKRIEK